MKEISSGGREGFSADYETNLGHLFEKKRAGYVRFAASLLMRNGVFPESDRLELAKDIVQQAFLALLKNRSINFSLSSDEIESYTGKYIAGRVFRYLDKYYRARSKNPFKIPEKSYVTLEGEAEEIIDSAPSSNPDKRMEEQEFAERLNAVLETLSPREEKILRMRNALPPYEKEYSLEEIGKKLGVTFERVRQIEYKALSKMRHPFRAHKLRGEKW